MPKFEYKTEVLTTVVGRETLRIGYLSDALCWHGRVGWVWFSLTLDAALRGARNGHLLIFKRAVEESEAASAPAEAEVSEEEYEAAAAAGDPWSRGWLDAERAADEEE